MRDGIVGRGGLIDKAFYMLPYSHIRHLGEHRLDSSGHGKRMQCQIQHPCQRGLKQTLQWVCRMNQGPEKSGLPDIYDTVDPRCIVLMLDGKVIIRGRNALVSTWF